MNTYLQTALLAGFLALGGLGDELSDLCQRNITDANLSSELDKLSLTRDVLDLCGNQLKSFDGNTFLRFQQLEELGFDHNSDLGFPPDGSPFLVVKMLRKLQCIECGVDKIYNRSMHDLPKIEYINLTNNRITEIESAAFRKNSELQIIDLKHNLLERLPSEMIEGLLKMEQLDVSFNRKLRIDEDRPFLLNKVLKKLSCKGCGFSVIYEQTFSGLPSLRELNLRENTIVDIRIGAFQIQRNLEKLWLQNNRLEIVYDELMTNEHLQLCLDNNTEKLMCRLKNRETWQKVQCQNDTITEVDCNQFTEPTTELTTILVETTTTTTTTINTETITTTTKVTTEAVQRASAEQSGISDWYISSYLTIIILTQIGALVILVGVWLKMKKYDSDPEVDRLAGTILNPSSIYKPLY